MARRPKTAVELGKVYWRRKLAHDKTGKRVVFVVCTAGAFIGCVDKIKIEKVTQGDKDDRSLIRRRKIDKVTKIDKATRVSR